MAHRCENQEAHKHPQASDDERRSSSKLLYHIKSRDGHAKVDTTQDHGCNIRVLDTDRLEDGGAIVEVAGQKVSM